MKISDQLKILKTLKKRLKGKCSDHPSTCPHEISRELEFIVPIWECDKCVDIFKDIINLYSHEYGLTCPCEAVGDVAVTRVNEYINELKEEIKKWPMN